MFVTNPEVGELHRDSRVHHRVMVFGLNLLVQEPVSQLAQRHLVADFGRVVGVGEVVLKRGVKRK